MNQMAKNPYDILGIKKMADDKEIKSSYRTLAKKYHPDLNPDNKQADEKFKEISAAYSLLSDKEKRAAYDRGEIDMDGNPQYQQQQSYKNYAEGPQGKRYHSTAGGEFNQEDIESIFGSFFNGGGGRKQSGFTAPSMDAHYVIEVDFLEAAKGTKKRLTMPDGKALDLSIPEGTQEGQKLRLKGKGAAGDASRPAGDAYIEIHIKPHPFYTSKGKDTYVEIPIGLHESVLGSKVQIPTIHGNVEMSIPKGASTGTKLRLKGKGIKGGDQYVLLKIVMPEVVDSELEALMQTWVKTHAYNPRKSKEFTS